jgi:hypothetical protein
MVDRFIQGPFEAAQPGQKEGTAELSTTSEQQILHLYFVKSLMFEYLTHKIAISIPILLISYFPL